MSFILSRLRPLLIPASPAQQERMKIWAASAVGYVLYSTVQVVEVAFGLLDRATSDALIVAMALNTLTFYALYRSGLNERYGRDPGMSLPQILIGCALSLWSYSVTGPARGAILLILASTLMYGVFSLKPRHSRGLVAAALAGLGGVMVWCTTRDSAPYPWRLELVHFLFATIVMWTMAVLAGQLGALRSRLSRQTRELKQAMEQLQLLATRDELTQIHNRRHMTELMTVQAQQHERSGAPLCLALLDIDLFKSINDRFGHAAGDKVLQHFAAVARDELRTSDLLCRWGGEEFLVLFPDTPMDMAHVALQRLHQRLRGDALPCLDGQCITISAGLTEWIRGEPMDVATERADQAMYRAKTGGRDRTEALVAGPPPDRSAAVRDIVGIARAARTAVPAQRWQ